MRQPSEEYGRRPLTTDEWLTFRTEQLEDVEQFVEEPAYPSWASELWSDADDHG